MTAQQKEVYLLDSTVENVLTLYVDNFSSNPTWSTLHAQHGAKAGNRSLDGAVLLWTCRG